MISTWKRQIIFNYTQLHIAIHLQKFHPLASFAAINCTKIQNVWQTTAEVKTLHIHCLFGILAAENFGIGQNASPVTKWEDVSEDYVMCCITIHASRSRLDLHALTHCSSQILSHKLRYAKAQIQLRISSCGDFRICIIPFLLLQVHLSGLTILWKLASDRWTGEVV